jgi:hypothetical protein
VVGKRFGLSIYVVSRIYRRTSYTWVK